MTKRQTPPGRTSISAVVVEKPSGPHQWATCSGRVKASQTSSLGALKRRETTISRSDGEVASDPFPIGVCSPLFLVILGLASCRFALQRAQVRVKTIKAAFPKVTITVDPIGHLAQRRCIQAARAPLGPSPLFDQPSALEDFEVLGDGRRADVEGLGQFLDRGLTLGQALENGPAGRIGQCGEKSAEMILGHWPAPF